jgi:hypothetical protein
LNAKDKSDFVVKYSKDLPGQFVLKVVWRICLRGILN